MGRHRVNLLDRHIFKHVLYTCAGAVGLFAFVVALANFVKDLLGPLLAGQIGYTMLFKLLALLFPFAISYALPMGILTGVLLTLGRLSADSEITAMRAAGIGLVRVARPVFILAVLGAATALYVNYEAMPWARVQYYRQFAQAMRTNPLSFLVPKTYIRDFKGVVVYVGDRTPGTALLRDIWIWELDGQSRVKRLVRAESGRVDYDEATNSLVPTLFRAKVEERDGDNPEDFSKSPRAPSVERAQDVRLSLAGNLGQNRIRSKPEWMQYEALQARRAELARQQPEPGRERELGLQRMKLAMIVQEKTSLALAVLTFAFVAVPLGIKVSRRETSANLGVSVLIVLGYYVALTAVKWLDGRPDLRPDLLLWLPNLVLFGFGLWLLRRVER